MQILFLDSVMRPMYLLVERVKSTFSEVSLKKNEEMILFVIDSGSTPNPLLEKEYDFSGSMTAYNISATGDGPSPRLGHACILVGNAFIGILFSLKED